MSSVTEKTRALAVLKMDATRSAARAASDDRKATLDDEEEEEAEASLPVTASSPHEDRRT